MEQFFEFFSKLFSTADWPPRWYCGKWSEFHGWLYVGSDIAIWLAYFIIPGILIWFLQRKPNIPFLPVFWLFSAFILLCGSTHMIDAIIFWEPHYRISAVVKFLTAIISLLTVFALIRDLPKALNIKTITTLDEELLRKKIEHQQKTIIQLQEEIDNLKANEL